MAIRTSRQGASELRELLGKLQRASTVVESALSWCEENSEDLFVFKVSSQIVAMQKLRSYENELSESLIAAQAGRPFNAETLKPRASGSGASNIRGVSPASAIDAPDPIDGVAAKKSAKKASQKTQARKSSASDPKSKKARKQG